MKRSEELPQRAGDRRTINPATLEKLRTTILDLFASALYQDVGIRTICERAKVSPQTVYKYFGNKEEILYACIKSDMDGLNAAMLEAARGQDSLPEQIRALLAVWCDFYFENPGIARIVFLNIPQAYWVGERQFVQSALHRVLFDQLHQGQMEGVAWDGIAADMLNEMMMGAGHRLMIRWLMAEEASEANVRNAVKDSFIQGVLKLIQP